MLIVNSVEFAQVELLHDHVLLTRLHVPGLIPTVHFDRSQRELRERREAGELAECPAFRNEEGAGLEHFRIIGHCGRSRPHDHHHVACPCAHALRCRSVRYITSRWA